MSEQDLSTEVVSTDDASGIPVLPLRDVVVYPHMVIPLFVGRDKSIVALDKAMAAGKRILLVAQKKADLDDPQPVLTGNDVADLLDLAEGPDIGEAMAWLREVRFAEGPVDREEARRRLVEWWPTRRPRG